MPTMTSTTSYLEASSFTHDDQILGTDITVEEVEAFVNLKQGRSKGTDGLNSEHFIHGGPSLILWLKKISTKLSFLKRSQLASKKALSFLFTKEREKTPCSVVAIVTLQLPLSWPRPLKLLSSARCHRSWMKSDSQISIQLPIRKAFPVLTRSSVPKKYIRQGENPFLCYDIEKAFDSVKFPILLDHLFKMGINGKSWHFIKAWYQSPTSCVKHNDCVSAPFLISRGVKQGSVLSPTLFLVIMNSLLQRMRSLNSGGSLHGFFAGSAVHADDLRSIALSIDSSFSQSSEINSFTNDAGLKLNTSKLEVIQKPTEPLEITLGDTTITTKKSARCLGVQWQSNLSAKDSVSSNIAKARKAFFYTRQYKSLPRRSQSPLQLKYL